MLDRAQAGGVRVCVGCRCARVRARVGARAAQLACVAVLDVELRAPPVRARAAAAAVAVSAGPEARLARESGRRTPARAGLAAAGGWYSAVLTRPAGATRITRVRAGRASPCDFVRFAHLRAAARPSARRTPRAPHERTARQSRRSERARKTPSARRLRTNGARATGGYPGFLWSGRGYLQRRSGLLIAASGARLFIARVRVGAGRGARALVSTPASSVE